jgi:hypothetical protein
VHLNPGGATSFEERVVLDGVPDRSLEDRLGVVDESFVFFWCPLRGCAGTVSEAMVEHTQDCNGLPTAVLGFLGLLEGSFLVDLPPLIGFL